MRSEDAHGIFSVVRVDESRLRVLNNRTDLVYLYGDPITQYVQESQAFLPILYAPKLEKALVIGSGYGITAGAFSPVAEVSSIDAVEIVPALVEHADAVQPGQSRLLFSNPRVKIHVTDGRHFLATTTERYDIISINVSEAYLPGSSSLFSSEFYELAKSRLKPGGVLAQHIFGPDMVLAVPRHPRGVPVREGHPCVRGRADGDRVGGAAAAASARAVHAALRRGACAVWDDRHNKDGLAGFERLVAAGG